jgi:hypothetical protein
MLGRWAGHLKITWPSAAVNQTSTTTTSLVPVRDPLAPDRTTDPRGARALGCRCPAREISSRSAKGPSEPGAAPLWRPYPTRLGQDSADGNVRPVKQAGNLVERLPFLPALPHQRLLRVRMRDPWPSGHSHTPSALAVLVCCINRLNPPSEIDIAYSEAFQSKAKSVSEAWQGVHGPPIRGRRLRKSLWSARPQCKQALCTSIAALRCPTDRCGRGPAADKTECLACCLLNL